ncbi:aspartate aminotransferase [Phaffia rhodozyma]|uniref:Aspartate aminotransferase n=1 Tax=Phaffia rhodozyma TaxID=264483 RepID=A0A0F7SQ42_PHARH|nr:aspartate aminotransferase [Phaffia rhodozyma]
MTYDYFACLPLADRDQIAGLNEGFATDSAPHKVNLGMGTYKDENGKPWVLPVVRKASAILAANADLDHEYNPISGIPEFYNAAAKLIFGPNSKAIKEGRVSSTHTVSGTGSNQLGALFLQHFYDFPSSGKKIHVPNPTWVNHDPLFRLAGLEPVEYAYYDPKTIGLDFPGFKGSLEQAEEGSVFLVHACAHNPTGVDPTAEQWEELVEVILAKKHFIFIDAAYQGFASGDLDKDASTIRLLTDRNVPLLVCQSFSKNAGLYGQRVGALHVVTASKAIAHNVHSQVENLQRAQISCPPAWGARVVTLILNTPELFELWKIDVKMMADRIKAIRKTLRAELEKLGTPGTWDHITNQIGMFSYTGLTPAQSRALIDKSYYLLTSGRISMSSLNEHNVAAFAKAIDEVVRA